MGLCCRPVAYDLFNCICSTRRVHSRWMPISFASTWCRWWRSLRPCARNVKKILSNCWGVASRSAACRYVVVVTMHIEVLRITNVTPSLWPTLVSLPRGGRCGFCGILAAPICSTRKYYVCCNYLWRKGGKLPKVGGTSLPYGGCERRPAALFIASSIGHDKYYYPLALIICDAPLTVQCCCVVLTVFAVFYLDIPVLCKRNRVLGQRLSVLFVLFGSGLTLGEAGPHDVLNITTASTSRVRGSGGRTGRFAPSEGAT
jgi:hypothetical protein